MLIYYMIYLINILLILILISFFGSINERFMLKFIHIPKNAGTSIENAGLKHNIHWGFKEWTKQDHKKNEKIFKNKNPWINVYNKKEPNNNRCYPWHRNYGDLGPGFLKTDDKTFCVIRNPYTKIVSAYKYAHGNKSSKEGLNKFINDKLSIFKDNMYWNGCHILPQHKFTHEKIKCDNLLRFENLEKDFDSLMKKNNLQQMKLSSDNPTKNIKLSYKDLDDDSIKLINQVYDKDFKLYNYKKM